jgi:hypothetical protein
MLTLEALELMCREPTLTTTEAVTESGGSPVALGGDRRAAAAGVQGRVQDHAVRHPTGLKHNERLADSHRVAR